MIYGVIEEDDWSHIKIGHTTTADNKVSALAACVRASSLQTGNRRSLYVVCGQPGTCDDERALHARFASSRVGGEWFIVTPDVRLWIAGCAFSKPMHARSNQGKVARRRDLLAESHSMATYRRNREIKQRRQAMEAKAARARERETRQALAATMNAAPTDDARIGMMRRAALAICNQKGLAVNDTDVVNPYATALERFRLKTG
jgi:hypothetical protein